MNAESNLSERILAEQERMFFAPRPLGTIKIPEPVRYVSNRAQRRFVAKMQRRKHAKVG